MLRLVEFRDQIKLRSLNRRCQLIVDGIVGAVEGKDVPSTRSLDRQCTGKPQQRYDEPMQFVIVRL